MFIKGFEIFTEMNPVENCLFKVRNKETRTTSMDVVLVFIVEF